MPFLSALDDSELMILEGYLESVRFPKESCILHEGEPGDGCYLIDNGLVRLELHGAETDSEGVIAYLEAGMFLGEFSLLDEQPRSASAYAQTDVEARWFATASFREMCQHHPHIATTIASALAIDLTGKLRRMNQQLAEHLFAHEIDARTNETVASAKAAQHAFQGWSEERVDALLTDIAQAIAEHAEALGQATVSETDMGVATDKTQKIRVASLDVCKTLVGKTAAGPLREDEKLQITEFASPVGVILGLIPVTNPVPTIIFKTLVSLKGRNALILSCHRRALNTGNQAVDIVRAVLAQHDAPENLVQSIRERTSRQKTMMFMQHQDVSFVLATGGASMVKAAYSSGTPAIGVGSGNAPVLICSDADIEAAAQKIIQSKSFDNGVICGSENNLVVVDSVSEPFIAELQKNGAMILRPDEKRRLIAQIFNPETHTLDPAVVGKSAQAIADSTGIRHDGSTRLLVIPVGLDELRSPCVREKLAPMLSMIVVADEEQGIQVCKQILDAQGRGHTAVIHAQSKSWVDQFGHEMEVSRILVNTPASLGCIGIGNGLVPSFTLGCGTFGGNSTSDNVTYTHLLNIRRLALNLS